MIKSYTLVRVDCDYCDQSYPNKKDVIHFQNEGDANKTVCQNGWSIIDERHVCPACAKVFCETESAINNMFKNRTDES